MPSIALGSTVSLRPALVARLPMAAAVLATGAFSWQAFHGEVFAAPASLRFLAAFFVLWLAWRFVTNRWQAFAVLTAWFAGASAFIPALYLAFFGQGSFAAVGFYVLFVVLAVAPLLILPGAWRPAWLPLTVTLSALSPVGAFSPLLGAMALFPGWGVFGLCAALAVMVAAGLGNRISFRAFIALAGSLILVAASLNAAYRLPALPHDVWGLHTHEGAHPGGYPEWMARQKRVSGMALESARAGATLVVTPENTVDKDGLLDTVHWLHALTLTIERSQLIVGFQHGGENYLLDMASGRKYHSTMPMVVGMWHPWQSAGHHPIRLDALTDLLETERHGRVPYLLCYEEMLIFPLAAKMLVADRPGFVVSAANQWFVDGAPGARLAQDRSLEINARLWGVPILRAVNHPVF